MRRSRGGSRGPQRGTGRGFPAKRSASLSLAQQGGFGPPRGGSSYGSTPPTSLAQGRSTSSVGSGGRSELTGQTSGKSISSREELPQRGTRFEGYLQKVGLSMNDPKWNERVNQDNDLSVTCAKVVAPRLTVCRQPPEGITVPEGYVVVPLKAAIDQEYDMVAKTADGFRYGEPKEAKFAYNWEKLKTNTEEPMRSDHIAGQPLGCYEVDPGRTSQNMVLPELARQFEKPQGPEPSEADKVLYERSRELHGHIPEQSFNFVRDNPDAEGPSENATGDFELNRSHPNCIGYIAPEYPTPYSGCCTGTRELLLQAHVYKDSRLNVIRSEDVAGMTVGGRSPDSYMENQENGYYDSVSQEAAEMGITETLKSKGFSPLPVSQHGMLMIDEKGKKRRVAWNEYSLDGHAVSQNSRMFDLEKLDYNDDNTWQLVKDHDLAMAHTIESTERFMENAELEPGTAYKLDFDVPISMETLKRLYSKGPDSSSLTQQEALQILQYLSFRPLGDNKYFNLIQYPKGQKEGEDALHFLGSSLPTVYAIYWDYVIPTEEAPNPESAGVRPFMEPPGDWQIGQKLPFCIYLQQMHGGTAIQSFQLFDPRCRKLINEEHTRKLLEVFMDRKNTFIHEGDPMEFLVGFGQATGMWLNEPNFAQHVSLREMAKAAGLKIKQLDKECAPSLCTLYALLTLTDRTPVLYGDHLEVPKSGSFDQWNEKNGFGKYPIGVEWPVAQKLRIGLLRAAMTFDCAILLCLMTDWKFFGALPDQYKNLIERVKAAGDAKYLLSPYRFAVGLNGEVGHCPLFPREDNLVKTQECRNLAQAMRHELASFEPRVQKLTKRFGSQAEENKIAHRALRVEAVTHANNFLQVAHKTIVQKSVATGSDFNYGLMAVAFQCSHLIALEIMDCMNQEYITSANSKFMRGIIARNLNRKRYPLVAPLSCLVGFDSFEPLEPHDQTQCDCLDKKKSQHLFIPYRAKPRLDPRQEALMDPMPLDGKNQQLFMASAFEGIDKWYMEALAETSILMPNQNLTDHLEETVRGYGVPWMEITEMSSIGKLINMYPVEQVNGEIRFEYCRDNDEYLAKMGEVLQQKQMQVPVEFRKEVTKEMATAAIVSLYGKEKNWPTAAEEVQGEAMSKEAQHARGPGRFGLLGTKESVLSLLNETQAKEEVLRKMATQNYQGTVVNNQCESLQYEALIFAARAMLAYFNAEGYETEMIYWQALAERLNQLPELIGCASWHLYRIEFMVQKAKLPGEFFEGEKACTRLFSETRHYRTIVHRLMSAVRLQRKEMLQLFEKLKRHPLVQREAQGQSVAWFNDVRQQSSQDIAARQKLLTVLEEVQQKERVDFIKFFHIYLRKREREERDRICQTPEAASTPTPMDTSESIEEGEEAELRELAARQGRSEFRIPKKKTELVSPMAKRSGEGLEGPLSKGARMQVEDPYPKSYPKRAAAQMKEKMLPPKNYWPLRSVLNDDYVKATMEAPPSEAYQRTLRDVPIGVPKHKPDRPVNFDINAEIDRDREQMGQLVRDGTADFKFSTNSSRLLVDFAKRILADPTNVMTNILTQKVVHPIRLIHNMSDELRRRGFDGGRASVVDYRAVGELTESQNFEMNRMLAYSNRDRQTINELHVSPYRQNDKYANANLARYFEKVMPQNVADPKEKPVMRQETFHIAPTLPQEVVAQLNAAYQKKPPFETHQGHKPRWQGEKQEDSPRLL